MYSLTSKCMVIFLFLDAYDRKDSFDICYVYQNYMSVLSERKLPSKYYISVFSAAINENNRYVADCIVDIFFEDTDHFPNKFKNNYKELYSEKWEISDE